MSSGQKTMRQKLSGLFTSSATRKKREQEEKEKAKKAKATAIKAKAKDGATKEGGGN